MHIYSQGCRTFGPQRNAATESHDRRASPPSRSAGISVYLSFVSLMFSFDSLWQTPGAGWSRKNLGTLQSSCRFLWLAEHDWPAATFSSALLQLATSAPPSFLHPVTLHTSTPPPTHKWCTWFSPGHCNPFMLLHWSGLKEGSEGSLLHNAAGGTSGIKDSAIMCVNYLLTRKLYFCKYEEKCKHREKERERARDIDSESEPLC